MFPYSAFSLVHLWYMLTRQSTDLGDFHVFLREGELRIPRSLSAGVLLSPRNLDIIPRAPCIWLCVSPRRLLEEFQHSFREGVPRSWVDVPVFMQRCLVVPQTRSSTSSWRFDVVVKRLFRRIPSGR